MNPKYNLPLAALLLLSTSNALPAPAVGGNRIDSRPRLQITVDPRVELISLIFRLAGNREYNQARVASYADDAEAQFGKFREHPAVKLARQLRQANGISYDACMAMAVHVAEVDGFKLKVPLNPWPESLDRRWTPQSVTNFLDAARSFAGDTGFQEFFSKHRSLYETAETRMKTMVEKNAHLEWFDTYFGQRPQATFKVVLGLLNGGSCYGPHFRDAAGQEELYCILGVWQTDAAGLPEFTGDMLDTVVHEFGHSYANPIIDRHEAEFRPAGEILFASVAERMRAQAYGEATTMLRESLVRACVTRYISQYRGSVATERAIREEEKHGFLWTKELAGVLDDFEAHRDQYPTLETFAPRLVSFFKEYAAGFAERQAALDAKRPKIVSMVPANGATNVSPNLAELRVTFDRPMKDRSWSMCGGGPHVPESTGQPAYNADRTVWTVPVKLKPDWDYDFSLNCQSYDAFRSEEGNPLAPVPVRFHTRDGSVEGKK
jgi:hypothetical protein